MDESDLDLFYKPLFLQYRQSQLDILLFVFPLFVFLATNHHSTVDNGFRHFYEKQNKRISLQLNYWRESLNRIQNEQN